MRSNELIKNCVTAITIIKTNDGAIEQNGDSNKQLLVNWKINCGVNPDSQPIFFFDDSMYKVFTKELLDSKKS